MNALLSEIRRSLVELDKGLKGQLNMSQSMEDLVTAFGLNEWPGRNPFAQVKLKLGGSYAIETYVHYEVPLLRSGHRHTERLTTERSCLEQGSLMPLWIVRVNE